MESLTLDLEKVLNEDVQKVMQSCYQFDCGEIAWQKTRKEFKGDLTMVVFPFLKQSKKGPEQTAAEIGEALVQVSDVVAGYNVVKGFLNLEIDPGFWKAFYQSLSTNDSYGIQWATDESEKVMVEYSSPNTNKPLHLGHIRNNLLGYSVAQIYEANNKKSVKVQIVNDRGIHICKSMLAWQKFANGETPETSGIKPDHFVGKYYVAFETAYRAEIKELIETKGWTKEQAEKSAPLMEEAKEMLRKWENNDPETIELWKKMNQWCYDGFDATYKALGVDFDKLYFESNTYILGKDVVLKGVEDGIFFKKEDGSIWVDLTDEGLDQKLLLRSDGTSVYMTQDIGTAIERFKEYDIKGLVYTVADEQDYHFKVLFLILKKLGYDWWKGLFHLSYGMVDLPTGRMKSREGTVVDADDLVAEMIATAKSKCEEKGIGGNLSEEELNEIYRKVGLSALKYYILKVDPKKRMTFNPEESIDFNGNTGPLIQYTYVRTRSIERKANEEALDYRSFNMESIELSDKEIDLIKLMRGFAVTVKEAADKFNPSLIAAFAYELAKEYNSYYASSTILKEEDANHRNFKINLSLTVGNTIKNAMKLLGIEMPERM